MNTSTLPPQGPPQTPDGELRLIPGLSPAKDYELLNRLGRGGFSEVWEAKGPRGRCALKIIKPQVPLIELELRPLTQMKDLKHPHLLAVHGHWFWGPSLVIEMDLADRSLLKHHKERGGIPRAELLRYLAEAAEGIDYLNDNNIFHRDIKPDNLLLKDGHLLVADFSLAKEVTQTSAKHTTGLATFAYAPPEFLLPQPRVTAYSDQFSLALTYCYLRTNRFPFATGKRQSPTEPVSLFGWPHGERTLLTKALHAKPEARYPDCRTLIRALAGAPPSPPPPPITNSLGMQFVVVPKGKLEMGSPQSEEGHSLAEPLHHVHLRHDFALAVFPVTQAEYERVMGHNPSHFKEVAGEDTSHFPVEQVSWEQAVDFCRRLSELPEEKAAERVYRLPTEAEWEYACRSATESTHPFHFANAVAALSSAEANFDGAHPYGGAGKGPFLGRPTVVGNYEPNVLGLFDMHGNVKEWCADWYEETYYTKSPTRDPKGPKKGARRLLRGGSWRSGGRLCRAACRDAQRPDYSSEEIGFRVVLEGDLCR